MTHTCLFHISGNQYPPFPATHHTRRIWDELAKGFDEYHIIARGETNLYIHSVEGSIHLHLLPAFGKRMWPFFFLSWLLPWFVIRYKPTHLLAQCPVLGGLSAAFCSRLFDIPLCVEIHGAHYFAPARLGWKGIAEHFLYKHLSTVTFLAATRIRSLSVDMNEHIARIYGETISKKVVVIPNRVDLDVFKFVKENYKTNDILRFITVGSFVQNKNHCALIEDLSKAKINFKLTLVGTGNLQGAYFTLAERLGVRNQIETVSLNHKSLAELLPKHDIYVHYSHYEGVSRAILEAMATGLPVVATRVGFIKGVLLDNENAIVIDSPYADGLIKSIKLLAESEEFRKQLGVAARHTIEQRFEWNYVFDLYRTAIKTMIYQLHS